jgi:hypothetical protein
MTEARKTETHLVSEIWRLLMALIKFVVQLIGGDPATLPVVVTTPLPVTLTQAGGPQTIGFEVQNTLGRPVTLENLSATVTVGDPAMIDVTMLDTVLALADGETKASSLTVTPNQEIIEGSPFELEINGAEAA